MENTGKKSLFLILLFIGLIVLIPVSVYFLRNQILSGISKFSETTKKQQIPKAGSCLVLQEEYCAKAQIVDWTNVAGQKTILIGFNLPPKTPIFMPYDGQSATIKLPGTDVLKGTKVIMFNENKTVQYNFYGDLQPDNKLQDNEGVIVSKRKGEIVNYVDNKGIKNADNYNLLFSILRIENSKTTKAEDEMKKIFNLKP